MSDKQLRKEFEAFISASPYEKCIERYPDEADKYAWPGNYKSLEVSMAWDAFRVGADHFNDRYSDTTPVDAAWLESMGAEWRKGTLILKANGHEIYQWSTGKRWSIQDESVSVAVYTLWYDNPTRGQLLHLLAALTK